ncbi:MAG TPA: hypothetical protein VG326_00215 [Tepidisphaeraceae bacterium]|jgi:hypothetical protein|nr:hypothetical protein [Tepidisphaeraceae bacterium]
MRCKTWVCAAFLSFAFGCNGPLKQAQLQGVAKDWCLTIRACEVMPVYPLTEDIQPGDVFLVHQTAEQEVASYTKNGFLPLRDIVARLPVSNYEEFYANRYGLTEGVMPPGNWQFPKTTPPTTQANYSDAPRVAFPSFSFSIKQGAGANASFPVSAIPVGLDLLQTGQATGTVSFGSAYTYGSDIKTVEESVQKWAQDSKNKSYLMEKVQSLHIKTAGNGKNQSHDIGRLMARINNDTTPTFLRVVTRVYLIDKVSVSLTDDSNAGATVSGGVPKTVDLGNLPEGNVPANYDAVNKLLTTAADGAPGGTLKLALATSRSVSLDTSFPRPLVLGYLSIDLEILDNGCLAAPVTTLKRISLLLNDHDQK